MEGGAGSNRDPNTIAALRYYQDADERIGKQQVSSMQNMADKSANESHRYYLTADEAPGKARVGCRPWRDMSQSTCADSVEADPPRARPAPSDCDSLPLGAEWSTWDRASFSQRPGSTCGS